MEIKNLNSLNNVKTAIEEEINLNSDKKEYLNENILIENVEYAKEAGKKCDEYFEKNYS